MEQYGLCGERLSHSYSEIIHKMLGNDAYRLLSMTRDEFAQRMKQRAFCAVNVTIPYKTDAFALCDEVSPEAKSIGSVNTVVNRGGRLYGYNTDIFGFKYMLSRAGIEVAGKKVIVLGTGGTSLTARAACRMLSAREIVTVSRSGREGVDYQSLYDGRCADAEILINTTPVGMYPDNGKTPVDLSPRFFPALEGVADVIYNPARTRLLFDAQARMLRTAGGLSMLVAQAVEADRLFFDKPVDEEKRNAAIERILASIEASVRNIVLVGMPGCGKSTVGRLLAERLCRPFIDADDYFTEKFGRTPEQVIRADGEARFRDLETASLADVTKKSSVVIACGGGAVIRPENRELIRQNGVCIYLTRDLDRLATEGRPLSAGGRERLAALFEARDPLYRAAADAVVPLNEDAASCADAIAESFGNAGNGKEEGTRV